MKVNLDLLRQDGSLTDLDIHFARMMARLAGDGDDAVLLAAALVSNRTGAGDVCLDLAAVAGRDLHLAGSEHGLAAPPLARWIEALRTVPIVGVPGDYRPLVLDEQNRLYLFRYWDYERRLAGELLRRATAVVDDCDMKGLRDGVMRLFPDVPNGETDWQRVAAVAAVLRRLCVISGGPGTGKTTTVVRILALVAEQATRAAPVIALAAPTGKAAARMCEAVIAAKQRLPVTPAARDAIPEEASTIHRLLGVRPDGLRFRHGKDNPLPVDVLVVDEASMVDLALMTHLAEALPAHATLILLGDKDQLASVEAGAVLADICGEAPGFSAELAQRVSAVAGVPSSVLRGGGMPIADSVVALRKSYRFGTHSGIGRLASAVNAGDGEEAIGLLEDLQFPAICRREPTGMAAMRETVGERVAPRYMAYLQAIRDGASVDEVFAAFNGFRVLVAHRTGPRGVDALNGLVEDALVAAGAISASEVWYPGRPVMVSRNDYGLRLFNGDLGIALSDSDAGGRVRVFFQGADGSVRRFYPGRLPDHDTVYAMTVHKSQGSEFDEVVLILPDEVSAVLSRELIYTGVTRARRGIEIWGTNEVLRAALQRRVQRTSGLRDALWKHA